jgi:iron-sulfur cluster repair protein YtfE (RIC family)
MDVIQFLKEPHQNAKTAFSGIEHALSPTTRAQLWRDLKPDLEAHEQAEDACLYGPISQDSAVKDQRLVTWRQQHQAQVHQVAEMIKTLDTLGFDNPRWLSTLGELRASLESHIRQEEEDIFPRIRSCWDGIRLERAGREMEEMKSQGPDPTLASPPTIDHGVIVAGPSGSSTSADMVFGSVAASMESLRENLYGYTRQQPGTALLGAVAVGTLLGILLMASRE